MCTYTVDIYLVYILNYLFLINLITYMDILMYLTLLWQPLHICRYIEGAFFLGVFCAVSLSANVGGSARRCE